MHIILLVLKIIGIILASLLGLLLLILLLLLFVPVRYKGTLCREKDLEIKAKLTWLLHMISVPVDFRDGQLSVKIKLFGFTIKRRTEEAEEIEEEADELLREAGTAVKREEEKISAGIENHLSKEDAVDKSGEKHVSELERALDVEDEETISKDEEMNEEKAEENGASQNFLKRLIGKIKAFFLKILKIRDKIRNLKYTFRRICGKIKNGIQKYRNTKEFLLDERTKKALAQCITQLKYLLRKLLPKKIRGELHFGTEDPALTGEILGGVSIFYPVFKDNVKVYPDFEQSILEGELFIKGRLRLVTVALILWKLRRDKNVRYVYHRLSER